MWCPHHRSPPHTESQHTHLIQYLFGAVLNDENGETDLLLRVSINEERIAILIENKVTAAEQQQQDLRYHLRGRRSQEEGRYHRFVTCICAPQIYLDDLPPNSAYEHRVSYEQIREWFLSQSGARAKWRLGIINEAIEQGRRGYVMKVHAGKSSFHLQYWEHLQINHSEFQMRRPTSKGPKSDWMIFKGADFPKGVKLVHKNDQACVDLEFERTRAADLAARRKANWPDGVRVLPRGASAALSLPVPRCAMDMGIAQQMDKVETALAAAKKLVPLANVMKSFDE